MYYFLYFQAQWAGNGALELLQDSKQKLKEITSNNIPA